MTDEKFDYLGTVQEALNAYQVEAEKGLNETEVQIRLEKYGKNKLKEEKKEAFIIKLLRQFQDFTVIILIIASIISAFTGDAIEAVLILSIVVVNAILGVYQEGRAEKAVEALQKMASPSARVIRSGIQQRIDAADIVPGDIVLLEAGDIVPADLRLIESSNLKAEEAALTGESVPVEKDAKSIVAAGTSLADIDNMVFASTAISYGNAKALVVKTGENTELGKIAGGLKSIEREETPLQQNINHLGKVLGIACIVIVIITFLVGILRRGNPMDLFMTSVSLAVAAIPEGLPAVVTIVLSLGMNRMAKKNAIVKRLLAVETLGSVNVICSDKTGTLTQNEMTVKEIYAGEDRYRVSGQGYKPEGEIFKLQADGETQASLENSNNCLIRLLEIAALCNDAELIAKEDGYSILGDPTEGALLTLAEKLNIERAELTLKHRKVADLPFDSERKMMSVLHEGFEYELISFTKGAPDIVLENSKYELKADGIIELDDSRRKEILAENSRMAKKALRVLAFAFKKANDGLESAENDMVFVGMVGMIDPARAEAKEAISICKQAGIRVVMITGDHMETAAAIADDLGLKGSNDRVVSGKELDQMTDKDLLEIISEVAVFARVSPEHKVRIVRILRESGAIASMTGDGVNDAPALKQADIGVAMGITGTEVAKGAADMVLTDDNFASIVSAVEEGRTIYSNIRKFVSFLLSCNIGEILVIFVSMMLLGPEMIPLLPVQLLWLNLVTDSFPALALGQEKGEKDNMLMKPRSRKDKILDKEMCLSIIVQSVAIFVTVFASFQVGRYFYPDILLDASGKVVEVASSFHFFAFDKFSPSDGARTFAFVTLICAELLRAFSSRSERSSVFRIGFFSNKTMLKASLISFILLLLVLYIPALDIVFHTVMLNIRDWSIIVVLFTIPFICGELFKVLYHGKKVKR